jgi:hypothetical protein
MASSGHIVSTTITTVGGFLPLILAGGGFWPPFAMAVAGGVALSTIVISTSCRRPIAWSTPGQRIGSP